MTSGSLGTVLIMGLEVAVGLKVICQEVQSPDWDLPSGDLLKCGLLSKTLNQTLSQAKMAERGPGVRLWGAADLLQWVGELCGHRGRVCRYTNLCSHSPGLVCE